MNERGSASIQALSFIILAAAIAGAFSIVFSLSGSIISSRGKSLEREATALAAIQEIMGYLEDSGEDGVDSRADLLNLPELPGVEVVVQDISSRFNPNLIRKGLLEKTGLAAVLTSGSTATDVQLRREEKGPALDIFSGYGDLIDEAALERWFTPYSYASVNTDDEFALEKLYEACTGSRADAARFHSNVQRQLRELKILSPSEYDAWYGLDASKAKPLIGAVPPLNANFADPFVLSTVLSYPAYELTAPDSVASRIQSLAESGSVSKGDLSSALGRDAPPALKAWFGTQTQFWRVMATVDGATFRAILRRNSFEGGPQAERVLSLVEFAAAGEHNDRLR